MNFHDPLINNANTNDLATILPFYRLEINERCYSFVVSWILVFPPETLSHLAYMWPNEMFNSSLDASTEWKNIYDNKFFGNLSFKRWAYSFYSI